MQEPQERLRLFVNHSGWAGGQLENELREGAWFTMPAKLEYIFYDDVDLWHRVTREIGRALLLDIVRPKHVPDDPSVN